jgi:hypothetical protein
MSQYFFATFTKKRKKFGLPAFFRCLVLFTCFDGHGDSSSRSQVSAKAEKQLCSVFAVETSHSSYIFSSSSCYRVSVLCFRLYLGENNKKYS